MIQRVAKKKQCMIVYSCGYLPNKMLLKVDHSQSVQFSNTWHLTIFSQLHASLPLQNKLKISTSLSARKYIPLTSFGPQNEKQWVPRISFPTRFHQNLFVWNHFLDNTSVATFLKTHQNYQSLLNWEVLLTPLLWQNSEEMRVVGRGWGCTFSWSVFQSSHMYLYLSTNLSSSRITTKSPASIVCDVMSTCFKSSGCSVQLGSKDYHVRTFMLFIKALLTVSYLVMPSSIKDLWLTCHHWGTQRKHLCCSSRGSPFPSFRKPARDNNQTI